MGIGKFVSLDENSLMRLKIMFSVTLLIDFTTLISRIFVFHQKDLRFNHYYVILFSFKDFRPEMGIQEYDLS